MHLVRFFKDPRRSKSIRYRCTLVQDVWSKLPIEAIGCVDITFWDLKGKILEQPVYRLLGGAIRSRIPAYATGGYYPVEGDEQS